MGFNIQNQSGGVINNVEGDQHIHGSQQGNVHSLIEVREAVQQLQDAVTGSGLNSADSKSVNDCLRDIDAEVKRPAPDKATVATRLKKITEIAKAAGTLAGLVGPIQIMVAWLGTLGKPIAKLLGLFT
ncbi:hypothetical protein D477_002206 [Arthrobacter crystallopoietes BAB-32]|uniref:Uncharacterized protein n=1 Tax=Arthrobacter crystallopoietes BAB-32 TaxID=1246476 RepID=N1V796_9MICC|nr:hypothetical protein [Arthrobacter crystallopoietes]EMY35859.1 hypothetical protein D477_002206 [Arthrobacter crystallopoietes BAB-32]